MKLETGNPWPLGAHWDGKGINFAVFSAHAHQMELCLFDETGERETARYALPAHTSDVWHGYLPDARPGLIYGPRTPAWPTRCPTWWSWWTSMRAGETTAPSG